MSFYASSDTWNSDDLCMREKTAPSEASYLQPRSHASNTYLIEFTVNSDLIDSIEQPCAYKIVGDFEDISTRLICRFLMHYSDFLVYPKTMAAEVAVLRGNSSYLSALRSKIGLPVEKVTSTDTYLQDESHLQHVIMFSIYHTLLESGFQTFATDDQHSGVVARFVDQSRLHVCALRQCTVNHKGIGCLSVDVYAYRVNPLWTLFPSTSWDWTQRQIAARDMESDGGEFKHCQLHGAEHFLRHRSYPKWQTVAPAVSAIFLPSNESVAIHAIIEYIPPHPPSMTAATASTCTGKRRVEATTTTNRGGASNTNCATQQEQLKQLQQNYREYEQRALLTALDHQNRRRGYNTYTPDTFARVKLYWQLAHGISVPLTNPAPTGSPQAQAQARSTTTTTTTAAASNSQTTPQLFMRIHSARLGEIVVPMQALVRSVAEIPTRAIMRTSQMHNSNNATGTMDKDNDTVNSSSMSINEYRTIANSIHQALHTAMTSNSSGGGTSVFASISTPVPSNTKRTVFQSARRMQARSSTGEKNMTTITARATATAIRSSYNNGETTASPSHRAVVPSFSEANAAISNVDDNHNDDDHSAFDSDANSDSLGSSQSTASPSSPVLLPPKSAAKRLSSHSKPRSVSINTTTTITRRQDQPKHGNLLVSVREHSKKGPSSATPQEQKKYKRQRTNHP